MRLFKRSLRSKGDFDKEVLGKNPEEEEAAKEGKKKLPNHNKTSSA